MKSTKLISKRVMVENHYSIPERPYGNVPTFRESWVKRRVAFCNPSTPKSPYGIGRGQISIEMLILWTVLAGVLAAMVPPFTQAMDTHQTITQIRVIETFSTQLEEGIERITYAGPGSQLTLRIPVIEKMEMEILSDQIILSYTHPSLSQTKEYSIQSVLPLNGTISPETDIHIVREEDSITIQ